MAKLRAARRSELVDAWVSRTPIEVFLDRQRNGLPERWVVTVKGVTSSEVRLEDLSGEHFTLERDKVMVGAKERGRGRLVTWLVDATALFRR